MVHLPVAVSRMEQEHRFSLLLKTSALLLPKGQFDVSQIEVTLSSCGLLPEDTAFQEKFWRRPITLHASQFVLEIAFNPAASEFVRLEPTSSSQPVLWFASVFNPPGRDESYEDRIVHSSLIHHFTSGVFSIAAWRHTYTTFRPKVGG